MAEVETFHSERAHVMNWRSGYKGKDDAGFGKLGGTSIEGGRSFIDIWKTIIKKTKYIWGVC